MKKILFILSAVVFFFSSTLFIYNDAAIAASGTLTIPAGEVTGGLGMIPGICVLPHHDTFGQGWAVRLAKTVPKSIFVGIDEETGILSEQPTGQWRVYGKGKATVYAGDAKACYKSGQAFSLKKQSGPTNRKGV